MAIDSLQVVHLENGRLASTPRALLDDTVRRLAADPRGGRLVIHVGAGLGPLDESLATAVRLLPWYRQAGCAPLFVVWEAGVGETLVCSVAQIAREGFFRALVRLVLKFGKAKFDQVRNRSGPETLTVDDGAFEMAMAALAAGGEPWARLDLGALPGETRLSQREEEQFREALARDPAFLRESACITTALALAGEAGAGHALHAADTLMNRLVLWDVRQELASHPATVRAVPERLLAGSARVLSRTIGRLASGRDHGLYPTAVEEVLREFYRGTLLTGVWDRMKQGAASAFDPDGRRFGGTAILEAVSALMGGGHAHALTLVAHSAGSIFASRVIEQAVIRLPRDTSIDVVLLAPAVTFECLAGMLASTSGRIRRFQIVGLDDAEERRDALVPGVYPRSLLYFVSGVLEDETDAPIAGMQRFHGGRVPLDGPSGRAAGRVLGHVQRGALETAWTTVGATAGESFPGNAHRRLERDTTTLDRVAHALTSGMPRELTARD